jgi:DICT domain-containing protein
MRCPERTPFTRFSAPFLDRIVRLAVYFDSSLCAVEGAHAPDVNAALETGQGTLQAGPKTPRAGRQLRLKENKWSLAAAS